MGLMTIFHTYHGVRISLSALKSIVLHCVSVGLSLKLNFACSWRNFNSKGWPKNIASRYMVTILAWRLESYVRVLENLFKLRSVNTNKSGIREEEFTEPFSAKCWCCLNLVAILQHWFITIDVSAFWLMWELKAFMEISLVFTFVFALSKAKLCSLLMCG